MLLLLTDAGNQLPPHMRCAAHTLNLVATTDADAALQKSPSYEKQFTSAMAKCRSLWNKQNQSTQASEVIKAQFKKKFVTPNATRWNSTYDSVVTLLEILQSCGSLSFFNSIISDKPVSCERFSQADVNFLQEYSTVMTPLANGLDQLQGEDHAYQGLFLPVICAIQTELLEAKTNPDLLNVKPLVNALLEGMKKRFSEAKKNENNLLAAAFHPMFKLLWIDNCQESITPLEKDNEEFHDDIVKKMKKLVVEELKKLGEQDIQAEEEPVEKNSPTPANEKEKNKSANWLSKLTARKKEPKSSAEESLKRKGNSIVDAWLDATYKPRGQNTKGFHDSAFMGEETLMKLFMKYNTGIPSSAGVERLFSIGKLIMRANRNRLSDENFEQAMFLKGNTKINLKV